jgi:peptidoglycan hydrolase-like protein with peptidoglycan-binding domain
MKLHPRSYWTSIVPRPSNEGEDTTGLSYFKAQPEVEFITPDKNLLYVYRNPAKELERLLKENTQSTGYADIDCNYALASNVAGAFVCRGRLTRCMKATKVKVLLLVGSSEKPSDLLKQNKRDFLRAWEGGLTGNPPPGTLRSAATGVHVFDLIEYLSEKGYYTTRNDGVYGPMLKRAVKEYQDDNGLKISGEWDEWAARLTKHGIRQPAISPMPPVGPNEITGATLDSMLGINA